MSEVRTVSDIRRIPILHVSRGMMNFDTWLEGEDFDFGKGGPRFEKGVRIEGDISIVDDQVLSHAKISADETASCSRCLEDVKKPFFRDFFLAFELPKERYIDLLPHLREEMLLEQPLQVLCRPKCKGLCATCGKNLNEGPCACAKRP